MKINNKKNEIIEVAYKLFIKKGYVNTSVAEIISKVKIAKGTFYYYFKTKEELLEEVTNFILKQEEQRAMQVLNSNMNTYEKLIGVIKEMQPSSSEVNIADEINRPENIIMHKKLNEKIIEILTPILVSIVKEGIENKLFNCDNIEERIRIILNMSSQLFDNDKYTSKTIIVFIDTIEKILGAKKNSLAFVTEFIK